MDKLLNAPIFASDRSFYAPDTIRSFKVDGVAVLGPPALDPDLHRALLAEAREQLDNDSWQLTGARENGEIAQDNRRANLGHVARTYLQSEAVRHWLLALTGEECAPSWSATCYTRYRGPSEHMGEHCDKADTCKYNILTYLHADWPPDQPPSPGLQLFVFEGDNSQSRLSVRLTARTNRVAAIFGSRHAHLRPRMVAGEELILLAGCFHVKG